MIGQLPDTVARAVVAILDDQIGISVEFKESRLRYAIKAPTSVMAVQAIREFVTEHPYGRNRFGQKWEKRVG